MASTEQKLTGWQLDASGPADYERYLVPKLFAPGAEALCGLAGIDAGDRVLDVGCGTGAVSRCAAERAGPAGHLVGVDINPAMLAHAKTIEAAGGCAIEWREGDAQALPVDNASFDAVLSQQVLQFVDDPERAVAEMARVLVPGGRLGLSVLRGIDYNPGYIHLVEALERHAGSEAATMMRSPFSWPGRERLRAVVRQQGFDQLHLIHGVANVRFPSAEAFLLQEAASSPLAGPLSELDERVRRDLIQDLAERLDSFTDDDGVVFPAETYLLSAIRH